MTKSNLGKSLSYISWVTVHTGEAMDEYYLLACSPHLAQSAFLHYQDHLPKGSNSIHSELGPTTAVIMLGTLNTFCSPKFQNVSRVRRGVQGPSQVSQGFKDHSSVEEHWLRIYIPLGSVPIYIALGSVPCATETKNLQISLKSEPFPLWNLAQNSTGNRGNLGEQCFSMAAKAQNSVLNQYKSPLCFASQRLMKTLLRWLHGIQSKKFWSMPTHLISKRFILLCITIVLSVLVIL